MSQPPETEHRFGPFRYDAAERRLYRGEEPVALPPKATDTLHALVERRGRVVEKDELMKLVWPDTTVEEIGLARNISLLRKAFGDDAEAYIETVPKRGYRFTAGQSTRPRRRRWLWLALPGAVLAVAAIIDWQFFEPSPYLPQGRRARLAALPFEVMDGALARSGISRSFNELLVVELSRLEGVSVVSPSTVERYRWVGIGPQVMGRLLGLDVILEGAIQKQDGGLLVTSRLADVHTARLIWAETHVQPAADVALARRIASEVGQKLAESRAKR